MYRYSALAFQPGAISVSQPAPTVPPTRVSFQLTAVLAVPTATRAAAEEDKAVVKGAGVRERAADFPKRNATRQIQQAPRRDESTQAATDRVVRPCLTEPENWSVRKKLLLKAPVPLAGNNERRRRRLGQRALAFLVRRVAFNADRRNSQTGAR